MLCNMNNISTISFFKKGWETVKANLLKIVAAALVLFVIQSLLDAVTSDGERGEMSPEMGILSLVATIVSLIVGAAVTSAVIRIVRGAPVELKVLSINASQVLRYVGVAAVMILIVAAFAAPLVGIAFTLGVTTFVEGSIDSGIIAFLVILAIALGVLIYINLRLMFATYLVVDGKAGVIAAIKESWIMTRGQIWTIVKLALLSLVVALLGAIALIVGLLVAIPVIAFTYAHYYVALVDQVKK